MGMLIAHALPHTEDKALAQELIAAVTCSSPRYVAAGHLFKAVTLSLEGKYNNKLQKSSAYISL
jgi:hypothetical protein